MNKMLKFKNMNMINKIINNSQNRNKNKNMILIKKMKKFNKKIQNNIKK